MSITYISPGHLEQVVLPHGCAGSGIGMGKKFKEGPPGNQVGNR